MDYFKEDFPTHCEEIKAAVNGDEAMRKKHPDWQSSHEQLKELFTKPKR